MKFKNREPHPFTKMMFSPKYANSQKTTEVTYVYASEKRTCRNHFDGDPLQLTGYWSYEYNSRQTALTLTYYNSDDAPSTVTKVSYQCARE
jgi:hypothetical protein